MAGIPHDLRAPANGIFNLHLKLFTLPSYFDGLLPKSLFATSKTFLYKSKARFRRFQNSPFGLKQLKSLFFSFTLIY
jgi:hypothetical protein